MDQWQKYIKEDVVLIIWVLSVCSMSLTSPFTLIESVDRTVLNPMRGNPTYIDLSRCNNTTSRQIRLQRSYPRLIATTTSSGGMYANREDINTIDQTFVIMLE